MSQSTTDLSEELKSIVEEINALKVRVDRIIEKHVLNAPNPLVDPIFESADITPGSVNQDRPMATDAVLIPGWSGWPTSSSPNVGK